MVGWHQKARGRWSGVALFGVLVVALGIAGCEPGLAPIERSVPKSFVKDYIALGDGFTAGVQSGALSKRLQLDSYPAQLSSAFQMLSDPSGAMVQPLVANPGFNSGDRVTAAGYLALVSLSPPEIVRAEWENPLLATPAFRDSMHHSFEIKREHFVPFRNLGIPRAYAYDLAVAIDSTTCWACDNGRPNLFFNTVLRLGLDGTQFADSLTAVGQAITLGPKLVTLWVGLAEIMDAAIVGDPNALPYDATVFGGWLSQILDTLLDETEAVVIAANLPSLATMPFFTALPGYVIDPYFEPVAHPVSGGRIAWLGEEGTAESDLQAGATELDDETIVLLSALELMQEGVGLPDVVLIRRIMDEQGLSEEEATAALPIEYPRHGEMLPASATLTTAEFLLLEGAVDAFNATIGDTCTARDVPVVDVRAVFESFAAGGLVFGGVGFENGHLTGGLFSLDGIHPSGVGYAAIANAWIDVINAETGAGVPPVDARAVMVP